MVHCLYPPLPKMSLHKNRAAFLPLSHWLGQRIVERTSSANLAVAAQMKSDRSAAPAGLGLGQLGRHRCAPGGEIGFELHEREKQSKEGLFPCLARVLPNGCLMSPLSSPVVLNGIGCSRNTAINLVHLGANGYAVRSTSSFSVFQRGTC